MTLDTLYRYLVERASKSEIDARLVSATETANAEVYEAGLRPSLEKMGATVTAVLLEGTRAYVAEVGDSRGYVLRDGVVHRLTLDQSFAQVALSAGALRPEEVATSPLRNLLVQAIGQTPDVSVALTALDLRQRDCLILASDGLTSKLSDEEIAGVILSSASLEQACARLVEIANGRGGEDNITVVLAGISAGAPEGTRDERFSGTFRVLREYRPAGHEGHAQ
jgi:serine/threonine protein phosphatase PrpC